MDAETFPDERVIKIVSRNFLAKRIDAEKNQGPQLKAHYDIQGYPTTIILDGNGLEVDRIVGYLPPEQFAAELERILNNEGTISDLQSKVKSDPNHVAYWQQLARKFEDRNDLASARDVWETIAELNPDLAEEAEYHVASYTAQVDGTVEDLKSFIRKYPDSKYIQNAYYAIVKYYKHIGDRDREIAYFKALSDFIVEHNLNDPNGLNSYAWRMSELEQNLQDALKKARLALKMIAGSENQARAQIMDTEAEVLWKMGKVNEAVSVIEECIALQPEDEYYIKQKNKFLASKS